MTTRPDEYATDKLTTRTTATTVYTCALASVTISHSARFAVPRCNSVRPGFRTTTYSLAGLEAGRVAHIHNTAPTAFPNKNLLTNRLLLACSFNLDALDTPGVFSILCDLFFLKREKDYSRRKWRLNRVGKRSDGCSSPTLFSDLDPSSRKENCCGRIESSRQLSRKPFTGKRNPLNGDLNLGCSLTMDLHDS